MQVACVPGRAWRAPRLSTSFAAWLALALSLMASQAPACVVGDPTGEPSLVITESPPDCCYGAWAGSLYGTASNVDTEDAVAVVYARTDLYYVQPFVDQVVELGCGGTFSCATRGGASYAVVLARRGWSPPPQMAQLPVPGGDVLAVAEAPEAQRTLAFAGRTWVVKNTGSVPYGPGANLWSDAADAVWVDALGRLHLRLTQRDGVWYSAEVYSTDYVGYGRYRFDVEGDLDALDPNVVFAGFFYSDQGDEADVEFSRWGDPGRAHNAQFVVQPDAPHTWSTQAATRQTLQFDWLPARIDFAAWSGAPDQFEAPLASWTHAGPVPTPDVERMRFNLWLHGAAPSDGNEVEVVIASFTHDTPTDARRAPAPLAVQALQTAPERIEYVLELPEAAPVGLGIFDVRGRLVARLVEQRLPAGRTHGVWRPGTADLGSGVYFLRVTSAGRRGASRFVFLR